MCLPVSVCMSSRLCHSLSARTPADRSILQLVCSLVSQSEFGLCACLSFWGGVLCAYLSVAHFVFLDAGEAGSKSIEAEADRDMSVESSTNRKHSSTLMLGGMKWGRNDMRLAGIGWMRCSYWGRSGWSRSGAAVWSGVRWMRLGCCEGSHREERAHDSAGEPTAPTAGCVRPP